MSRLLAWCALCGILSSVWCVTAARLGATFDEPTYLAAGLDRWRDGRIGGLMRLGTMPLPVDVVTLPALALFKDGVACGHRMCCVRSVGVSGRDRAGVWSDSTVSAIPDPGGQPFLVVSEGWGHATRLGRFFMSSPHLSFEDFSVVGDQFFTTANGDMLFATITGQFAGDPTVALEATLTGTITGGTGRFAGASGTYAFHITATPAAGGFGFDSVATFDGEISSVGSVK